MAMQVSIEGYDSLEQIGVGGMAAVYRARKVSIDKVVAIKVLFPYLACDESFIDRFQREAKAAARIQHENIVNVIDFGESEGAYFIVMEYYDGHALEDILKAQQSLPLDVAVLVLLEVCYGLESAHAKDIVHRDIKPGNIIYTSQGGIKIADFGLAKKSDSATMITQRGKVIGTPAYMSPEQAAGKNVDPQSDIFSLGVVAYELLCQRKPFEGDSYSEVLEKIQTQRPLSVANLNPLVQPDFERIVSRMLEKNTEDRYQSITEVIADLEKGMEKFKMTRDRRRLSSYIKDPDAYQDAYKKKTVSRCLSQGAYFMQRGRYHLDDAVLEFKRILYLDPENERAQKNLEKVTAELGKEQTRTVTPVRRPADKKDDASAAKKAQKPKKHSSVTVVAASSLPQRGKRKRNFFGAMTVAAMIVSAAYFGHHEGLLNLNFFNGSGNTAPALSVPKRLSVNGGEKVEFVLQAVDAEGDSVHFYGDDLPKGATLSPEGEFAWKVGRDQTGSHKLVFYADDGTSASLSETIVDVEADAPDVTFKKIKSVQMKAGQKFNRELRASSSSGKNISYSLVSGPEGMEISGRTLSWQSDADQSGTFKAVVEADDGLASEIQTVSIQVTPAMELVAQNPPTGRVELEMPQAADIYVDGTLKEKESRGLSIDLTGGQHVLKAELMGGVTGWMQTVDVKAGETLKIEAPQIEYGLLSVYFLGGVGELYIDGKRFAEQPPFTAVSIPTGIHTMSCKLTADSGAREFEVIIKENEETIIEYELGKDPVVTHESP